VSKSANAEHLADPTSFGVHLYRDFSTAEGAQSLRKTPILFADCEGLQAGQAFSNAQRVHSKTRQQNLILDLPITAKSYGKDGKAGIDLFYARFLYTISDVVVVVLSSDNKLLPDMRRLVEWAASAVYRSVNQLAQKTLILVRNMAPFDLDDFYDAERLKESLLGDLPNLWVGSDFLTEFVTDFNSKQSWKERKIHDNNDLLSKFFSTIRACNIPNTRTVPVHRAFEQYRALRYQIVDASQKSQILRFKNWMQYNVPMLSHILSRAFEHFRTSDEPFDFYTAARNDNPNPKSVSDHISNFVRHMHLLPEFPEDMVSNIVGLCLITWAIRHFGLGM
jgi:hypothetical protein